MQTKHENRTLGIYIVLLVGILIADNLLGINVSEYVYDIFFAVFFIIAGGSKIIIYMVSFLIPLVCTQHSIAHIWLIAIVVLISKKRFRISIPTVILMIYFAVLELSAHFIYSISDINRMLGYILTVWMLIYLIYENIDKENIDYTKCIQLYIGGTFVLCTLFFVNAISVVGTNISALLATGARFGSTRSTTFSGMSVGINANGLAYYSVLCVAFCLSQYKAFQQSNKKCLFIFALMTIISALVGMLTISRTWIITLVLTVLLFVFSSLNQPKKFLKYTMTIVILILIGFVLFSDNTIIIDSFQTRLFRADMVTGNGRTEIFLEYFNIFKSNIKYLIFGTGVTDYIDVTGMWQSMHNGLQQIIVCLGIPGGIVFLITLIIPLRGNAMTRQGIIYWIPWIILVVFTQSIQFLNPNMLMLPYAMAVFALRKSNEPSME